MTDTTPGADERRIRALLVTRGVGPDAAPPKPTARPRDWLDDIIDNPTPRPETRKTTPNPTPKPTAAPPPAKAPTAKLKPPPTKAKAPRKKKRKRPRPGTPRTAWDSRPPAPRQSLADAWQNIPHRLKWLVYHATAAAAGWPLGWVAWGTDTAAWYAAGHWTTPSAWTLYGLGAALLALHRHSRNWAPPIAWAATVPTSSITLGVLLYGTGYH